MNFLDGGKYILIDITSKVIRTDNAYDHIKSLMDKFDGNKERVQEECKGMGVVTSYCKSGKHTYRVEKIDFDKTPEDKF